MSSPMTDLELVRRYEPIVRYTEGEQFFPCAVERYVEQCSLWAHHPNGSEQLFVAEGKLNLEELAKPRQAGFGAVFYLKFIEPLNLAQYASFLLNRRGVKALQQIKKFRAGLGRLARVGYAARMMDALFSLTLLLRGRVPGATAAAAALTYHRTLKKGERYVYYARVFREHGWIALQYWFFYPFNNWRSGFNGVNDHEADWEMVMVYLYEKPDGAPAPRWVAYASHDYQGDDLRRRWDDRAEFETLDGHPLIYAAAGSHASYFRRGEYLTEIEIPYLDQFARVLDRARELWGRFLRQTPSDAPTSNVIRIPFVDYARGDGMSIGPGQSKTWTPVLLDPLPGWASQYRGLWGLYARDPISGENAPAGPLYHRDGAMRSSAYNPFGWAGLDKIPPPPAEMQTLEASRAALRARQTELDAEIQTRGAALLNMGVELSALKGNPHLTKLSQTLAAQTKTRADESKALRRERAEGRARLDALETRIARLNAGEDDSPRAHIHRLAQPASAAELSIGRWAEFWAATSIGFLLVGFVLLLVSAREQLLIGVIGMTTALVFVESVFRRQVAELINRITMALAIVATLLILYDFFWQIIVGAVLVAGLFLISENLRELRG